MLYAPRNDLGSRYVRHMRRAKKPSVKRVRLANLLKEF